MKVISDQSENTNTCLHLQVQMVQVHRDRLINTHRYFRFLRKETIQPASLWENETQYLVCKGITNHTKKLSDI